MRSRLLAAVPLAMLLCFLAGCHRPEPISGCTAIDDATPLCGFSRPEDMELLPDAHTLLISERGGAMRSDPGDLVLYDTASGVITRLAQLNAPGSERWGDTACRAPPGSGFAPQGIHLSRRGDGRWQVLVVNHGGRESVEFFEALVDAGGWRLAWRGCVTAPADASLRDVVALPPGGFLVSDARSRAHPWRDTVRALLGLDTGSVWYWSGTRFSRVPGTESRLPGGIALDADGRAFYLSAFLGDEVRKFSFPGGRLLGSVAVANPGNSQWTPQGRLLVASQRNVIEASVCLARPQGNCGGGFRIFEIDTDALERRTLVVRRGAPLGAASVAVQVGSDLYLGAYSGDRILRVPLPR